MKKALLAAAALALTPFAALAQSSSPSQSELADIEFYYGGRQGDSEVTLSGTGGNDQDFESGSLGLSGSYGYYFTDNIMGNIRQSLTYADPGDGDSTLNGSTRLGALYNFDLGAFRPWVGLNVGYIYGDGVNESFIAGPEAGLRYYVNPKTFLFAQAEYQFLFEDAGDADEAIDDGAFAYNFGVGFNF